MALAGFETPLSASKQPQTDALDRAAPGTGYNRWWYVFSVIFREIFLYLCFVVSLHIPAWELSVCPTYITTLIEALAHFVSLHVLKLSGREINGDLLM